MFQLDIKCQLLKVSEVICLKDLAKVFQINSFKSDELNEVNTREKIYFFSQGEEELDKNLFVLENQELCYVSLERKGGVWLFPNLYSLCCALVL